ncbi:MAG: dehypoxanthine futalosine cyclase [Deltaproteobacteria bacterium]|nr:dehypoxanthine futalosine cyclase [Deltaproteobacteria bacterium]
MKTQDRALEKAAANQRLSDVEALRLFEETDFLTIGDLANRRRLAMHPQPVVTYVVDRNINYTNVCISECRFCAYFRRSDDDEAFVITRDALGSKIQETLALGGTQILIQGGMNPALSLSDYLEMLRFIKENHPIHIHGFSPPEIAHMAETAGLSIAAVLTQLKAAGLDSIPGGGAEILVDRIRKKISPGKCSADTWLNVMATAHRLGLKTTATMMFGHIESPADIIEHLMKIRRLQDKTGGFTAFIPWTFQPKNTRIDVQTATAVEYLKTLAICRLVLDNVPNLQASWVTQGEKIAQMALAFGANDLGSTMIEENVVAAAGINFRLPETEMIRLIKSAGYQAVQRDCFYNHLTESHNP